MSVDERGKKRRLVGVDVEAIAAPDGAAIIDHLAHGPLHRFADWPNADVPRVAIGLYSVWRGEEFIYIGMAGRASEAVLHAAHQAGRACGLRDRLGSHATGRRSGDQFCVYVADRLVLPELASHQLSAVASGRLSLEHARARLHPAASRLPFLRLSGALRHGAIGDPTAGAPHPAGRKRLRTTAPEPASTARSATAAGGIAVTAITPETT